MRTRTAAVAVALVFAIDIFGATSAPPVSHRSR